MTSVLDNAIIMGREVTYGTPVTPTRGMEGKADSFKRAQEFLASTGFRQGTQVARSARRKVINMGGEGTLEFEVLNQGFGLILSQFLGQVDEAVQESDTAAYTTTVTTDTDGPGDSFTIQVQRVDMGGSVRAFTHEGCMITGWNLSHEVGGLLMANVSFDFEDVGTAFATQTSPTYPAGVPFDWTECVVTLDGTATDIKSFSLDGDLGLDVDRRFLRGSELKKQPCRKTLPQFNGSIDMEFEDLTQYSDFIEGAIVPITATWEGSNIAVGHDFEFAITMPACQYTGSSPEARLSDLPIQQLPFDVLWDESADAITMTYKSTDTAL